MRPSVRSILFYLFVLGYLSAFIPLHAQANSGSIVGTVSDPSGAVIPGATVTISNPVSSYSRSQTADNSGAYRFSNVPFNHYHLTALKDGFATFATDVDVKSIVSITTNIQLQV